jgi:hypothetical protein
MDPFGRFAFFTTARDASFVAVAGLTLMVAFSFDPALAFYIGAHVALIFSLVLIFRVMRLTEEHVTHTEPWRVLTPAERPAGEEGRRRARERLEEVLLRFAKGASAIASALFGTSLLASLS